MNRYTLFRQIAPADNVVHKACKCLESMRIEAVGGKEPMNRRYRIR